ncbi:MAG: hypothetical protein P8174_02310 [Gemmatimonadota bacterium]|jgi:hypothetical protein
MRTILKPKLMGLAMVALLGTTACATGGQAAPQEPSPNQAPKASQTSKTSQNANVAVSVTNNNLNDVDVYALEGGMYQRLAMVPSMDSVRVKLPEEAQMTGGVRLLVDPIGDPYSFFTGEILVSPGDNIRLTVANPLGLTNWFVS